MAADKTVPVETGENAILAALPPDERARLMPQLQLVDVETSRN
jgi:hypothetical protein